MCLLAKKQHWSLGVCILITKEGWQGGVEGIQMITLKELILNIGVLDEDLTIYVKQDEALSAQSELQLIKVPEDFDPAAFNGMAPLLDVWRASEVIEGKTRVKGVGSPSLEEKVNMFLEYIESGA